MITDIRSVPATTTISAALAIMREHDATHLVVVEEGRLLGILSASAYQRLVALAAARYHERRGQRGHPPGVRGRDLRIEHDRKGELETSDVRVDQRARRAAIDRDADDSEAAVAVPVPQRFERRHLRGTRVTPRR